MPELPEVETILQGLKEGSSNTPPLIGQVISGFSLFWAKTLATPDSATFRGFMRNRRILEISRRGKFLVLHLDQEYLLFHLRMSGDLSMQTGLGEPRESLPNSPHDRLYLHFASGWGLVFNDTRKFGRVWLTSDPASVFGRLGPEPLDTALDAAAFHALLHRQSRQIKPLLLDQNFLAGLGNIYTDEALFDARLHPLRLSSTLSTEESSALLYSIRKILNLGIENNGASIDWVYRGGDFQNHFQVYQQTGNPCPRCGHPIQKMKVGQRGTHFCPVCQPETRITDVR
ncbi:MAG: bifunctional DNA-formamidopyrimidine glycosylase/DNA-(apurinic or apyrimidinic site) lyase [Anaerolineaceae bacterium]